MVSAPTIWRVTAKMWIWLHGMWEDHNRFLQRGGAKVLDDMIGEGAIPPLVLVCADGDRSSFWTNAARENAAYEDLVTADLTDAFAAASSVIHLASVFGPAVEGPEVDDALDVVMARRVLAAADKAGIDRVVLLSSATVYGPWANNPVPLTEDAPLRPPPDLACAVLVGPVLVGPVLQAQHLGRDRAVDLR